MVDLNLQEEFLTKLVPVLDFARDNGLDWRWVETALQNTWSTHEGIHYWEPKRNVAQLG